MTSPLRSRILSGCVLSLALILTACGGGGGEDPTPTSPPATTAAKPTQPPVVVPATPTAETVEIATPAIPTAPVTGTPVVPSVGTPEVQATADVVASPVPDVIWVVSDSPGDGTGGSGAPGERENLIPDSATPEAAGTPVAQLTIEGCELPHVPTYIGDSDQGILIDDVNFRSGPGVDCEPLLDEPLGVGQTVTLTGGPVTQAADDTEWIEIEFNGVRGWIRADFVDIIP